MMPRHIMGSCHDEDCAACQHIYDRRVSGDEEREQYAEDDIDRLMDGRAADEFYGRSA